MCVCEEGLVNVFVDNFILYDSCCTAVELLCPQFQNAISTVTGKDAHTFIVQWVQSLGCTRFILCLLSTVSEGHLHSDRQGCAHIH